LPPKTTKAIKTVLQLHNYKEKHGCKILDCPLMELFVRLGEKVEVAEKKQKLLRRA
jgi:hypothetical protein